MSTKNQRFMISINKRLYKEVEVFMEENGMTTTSEATRELIRLGLETLKIEKAKKEEAERARQEKEQE